MRRATPRSRHSRQPELRSAPEVSIPTVLAVAGTVLMAVAIFVPFRARPPRWPELVEPSATRCDVRARLDLVDALASLRSPWALGVLHQAGAEETDATVRAAIAAALASSSIQSFVT